MSGVSSDRFGEYFFGKEWLWVLLISSSDDVLIFALGLDKLLEDQAALGLDVITPH